MEPPSTLSKMIRPPEVIPESDPAADGLAGVMAKSIAVAGLEQLHSQIEANFHKAKPSNPADFIKLLPTDGMCLNLTCEVEGQTGIASLDAELVGIINEVLTGHLDVSDMERTTRLPTLVDVALCRPFIDAMLGEFATILGELRGPKKTDTYKTELVIDDPSPHQFAEIQYWILPLEIKFGDGARTGALTILIPEENTEFASVRSNSGKSREQWSVVFQQSLQEAPTGFDVVLHRKHMRIGQIMRLKEGDMIEFPARALENLSIEAILDGKRRSFMGARLGEYEERRAAKIVSIGDEEPPLERTALLAVDDQG